IQSYSDSQNRWRNHTRMDGYRSSTDLCQPH
ncbi:hypothetical protein V3C99_009456, partial [Haemonchus contortus]